MNPEIQAIVDHIEATVATESDWSDVIEPLTPRQQQTLLPVLRQLKREGRFWRRVRIVDGDSVVTVVRGRHPNLPEDGE